MGRRRPSPAPALPAATVDARRAAAPLQPPDFSCGCSDGTPTRSNRAAATSRRCSYSRPIRNGANGCGLASGSGGGSRGSYGRTFRSCCRGYTRRSTSATARGPSGSTGGGSCGADCGSFFGRRTTAASARTTTAGRSYRDCSGTWCRTSSAAWTPRPSGASKRSSRRTGSRTSISTTA